jgi:16S rRNA C1402 N4-methylase RsmH
MITGKPVIAEIEEIKENKRSKSAKLRVFERNGEVWTPLR